LIPSHAEIGIMLAMVSKDRLQQLADDGIGLSRRTEDERTASELLKLSYRVLQLATPTMPVWEECVPKTRWLRVMAFSLSQGEGLQLKAHPARARG
jgi:hypothetical protein